MDCEDNISESREGEKVEGATGGLEMSSGWSALSNKFQEGALLHSPTMSDLARPTPYILEEFKMEGQEGNSECEAKKGPKRYVPCESPKSFAILDFCDQPVDLSELLKLTKGCGFMQFSDEPVDVKRFNLEEEQVGAIIERVFWWRFSIPCEQIPNIMFVLVPRKMTNDFDGKPSLFYILIGHHFIFPISL